jgi:hypothetical protein
MAAPFTAAELAHAMWANRPAPADVLIGLLMVLAARLVFGIPAPVGLAVQVLFLLAVTALIAIRQLKARGGPQ